MSNAIISPASDFERTARRRAGAKLGWFIHATVFVAVTLLLVLLAASSGRNWAIFPTVGWSVGLAIHGVVVFFVTGGSGLYEKLLARERSRLQLQRDPVVSRMIKYLIACGLALAAAYAQAGVGITQLPGLPGDGPVTVFYPSSTADKMVQRGPFTLQLAEQGDLQRGNGRLVVISHGSGGNAWVHSDLARALVEAGFIVAMPRHHADNSVDPSRPGPESWKLRPAEVSRAIDVVAQTPAFSALLSLDKVGMYGMSAGGHTALTLAGGRWSPSTLRSHCEAHISEDFPSCVGLATSLRGNFLDGLKKTVALSVIRNRFDDATWYTHVDPRIRAIVAGVPFAADFDAASLARPVVPLGLVTAAQDKWLTPRFHSDAILAACTTCVRIADLPNAGHGSLLSPPPPMEVLSDVARELIADPPGFDRTVLPEVDRKIAAFMRQHLLP